MKFYGLVYIIIFQWLYVLFCAKNLILGRTRTTDISYEIYDNVLPRVKWLNAFFVPQIFLGINQNP